MEPIPLPSRIHYELLLQLLERQTLSVIKPGSPHYTQVQTLIVTLRKALAQHKNLEESLERARLQIDYRWSLNADQVEFTAVPILPEAKQDSNPLI